MGNLFTNIFRKLLSGFVGIFVTIYNKLRSSKIARTLLIIVIIKFSIFYGFFKSYLFPVHLKPKWETEQHRIDDVTNSLIINHKKTDEND
jgi:ATP/ADP translocase